MIVHDFFKTNERALMDAWLDDLKVLNYQMPTVN